VSNDSITVAAVSVVLVAESQNPAIINPDFMKNNSIVPPEWEVQPPAILLPPLAQILYQSRVSATVDQNRCTFEQAIGGAFKDKYHVHECAVNYAKKLEYNYISLGLNWQLIIDQINPDEWLKNRFLRSGKWLNSLKPTAIAFSISGKDSATCNFTLRTGQEVPPDLVGAPIFLSCNIHFELENLPNKAKRITNILKNWKNHQDFLTTALKKYFKEDLA